MRLPIQPWKPHVETAGLLPLMRSTWVWLFRDQESHEIVFENFHIQAFMVFFCTANESFKVCTMWIPTWHNFVLTKRIKGKVCFCLNCFLVNDKNWVALDEEQSSAGLNGLLLTERNGPRKQLCHLANIVYTRGHSTQIRFHVNRPISQRLDSLTEALAIIVR